MSFKFCLLDGQKAACWKHHLPVVPGTLLTQKWLLWVHNFPLYLLKSLFLPLLLLKWLGFLFVRFKFKSPVSLNLIYFCYYFWVMGTCVLRCANVSAVGCPGEATGRSPWPAYWEPKWASSEEHMSGTVILVKNLWVGKSQAPGSDILLISAKGKLNSFLDAYVCIRKQVLLSWAFFFFSEKK